MALSSSFPGFTSERLTKIWFEGISPLGNPGPKLIFVRRFIPTEVDTCQGRHGSMTANKGSIVHYLIDRTLLEPDTVVDGGLLVVEDASRHRNLTVMTKSGPSYFVKKAQSWQPESSVTLRHESQCYSTIHQEPELSALSPLLPRFFLHDPEEQLLVLEFIPQAENLGALQRRRGDFPPTLAAAVGRALGCLHRPVPQRMHHRFLSHDDRLPWVLTFPSQQVGAQETLSPGNQQLLSMLRQERKFCELISGLCSKWESTALIHGDMKWENCIFVDAGPDGGASTLKLIDWETARMGDPCWDVGSILQAYLTAWVHSLPRKSETELDVTAPGCLPQMQPALKAFWRAYRETTAHPDRIMARRLRRSLEFGAARMVQTAFEHLVFSPLLTPATNTMAQLSFNILSQPDKAVCLLLDL